MEAQRIGAKVLRFQTRRPAVRPLPLPLQRFLARYPPGSVTDPAPITTETPPSVGELSTTEDVAEPPTMKPNPFKPHKNPTTGKWLPPVYSLRRQADLVKMAATHGVEDLLPFTVKKTEERAKRRMENGLRVKGTGVGQKVKGHEWERTLKGRLDKRRQAMLDMPRMIQAWKQRGHGRGWTKWPK